jgi:predicted RNase H-like HicB family nuclease
MSRHFSYTAVFEPAEVGGFVVTFPAIPGLATQGETLDEASGTAEDCLRAYLESLAIDGEPAPYQASELPPMRRITVAVAAWHA